MSIAVDERRDELERHGREYGRLRFAVGFTLGLLGDDAKVSKRWQSHPHLLADADHGAAIWSAAGWSGTPSSRSAPRT